MTRGPKSYVTLALVTLGDEPPGEFRIFSAGKVETTKGTFVFDDAAAKSVMADYKAHGVELMIDYDHASLDIGFDPSLSGKAAGWFTPEVRAGELWAVNVRWTPKAAEALRQKEWRFMSPAFALKDGRITSLLNVALTNMPATNNLEPLMAANAKTNVTLGADSGLSPKLIQGALDAVASKDAKSALDLMKQILAALLGGSDPDATTEDAPPPAGDGGADESTETPASQAADMAASRIAMSLTGKSNAAEAMAELARTYKVAVDLEKREAQLKADREAIEAGEYISLTADLVKAGQMSPALAWADSDKRIPSPMIKAMKLSDLRERVASLAGSKPKNIAPPAADKPGEVSSLTPTEIEMCKQMGCEPEAYLALKARRDGATTQVGV